MEKSRVKILTWYLDLIFLVQRSRLTWKQYFLLRHGEETSGELVDLNVDSNSLEICVAYADSGIFILFLQYSWKN